MTVRTNEVEVRAVIDSDLSIDVSFYMNSASIVVDRIVRKATRLGITIPDDELKLIETYLSAHFYALKELQYSEKATGRARGVYQGQTGMGFNSTLWGQMAVELDPTGELDGGDTEATLSWLGTPIE